VQSDNVSIVSTLMYSQSAFEKAWIRFLKHGIGVWLVTLRERLDLRGLPRSSRGGQETSICCCGRNAPRQNRRDLSAPTPSIITARQLFFDKTIENDKEISATHFPDS